MADAPNTVVIRQLLEALEQSSLRDEARALTRRFEERHWLGLGPLDIAQVAALVGQLQTLPVPREEAPPAPAPWSPLENHAAWVDGVPRGRELLSLVGELARCDDGDAAAALLTRLFVEHLRYEPDARDETSRLEPNATFRRLRTLARHDSFVVSLAELSGPSTYASNFQPLFRLHPYGLVVTLAPGWNACQFVYRTAKDSNHLVQRTRQLVGYLRGDEIQDNLVSWVKRLDSLRPSGGEDGAAMLRRAEDTLSASPSDVARHWASVPLDPREPPPGVAWNGLLAHERRAFLQEETRPREGRVFWGLERALRVVFPFPLADRRGRLCYRRYTLGEPPCPEAAFRSGGSWVRPVTLELELVLEDGTALPLSLTASVPEVDARGRLLLDGVWFRWVPRVLSEGALVEAGDLDLDLDLDLMEGEDEELVEELPLPETGLVPEEDGAEPELESPEALMEAVASAAPVRRFLAPRSPLSFVGASLCTLLELAAQRKLYSLRKYVQGYEGEARELPRVLGARLSGLNRRDALPLLVSKRFLGSVLEPASRRTAPEEALFILRDASGRESGHPPAWACPDVGAGLPPGTWLPVAGARLTPWGELALPLRDEAGRARLRVSRLPLPRVNPRAGGEEGAGPGEAWIAAELSSFAGLPAGRARDAAVFAARGLPLAEGLRVLHVEGRELRARATREAPLRPRAPLLRRLHVRLPAFLVPGETPRHEVLRGRGSTVSPGEVWLKAPLELWTPDADSRPLSTQRLHHVRSWNLTAHLFAVPPEPKGDEDAEPLGGRAGLRSCPPWPRCWRPPVSRRPCFSGGAGRPRWRRLRMRRLLVRWDGGLGGDAAPQTRPRGWGAVVGGALAVALWVWAHPGPFAGLRGV